MSQIVYPDGCDNAVLSHECDPCPRGEEGGVRAMFFRKKSVTFDYADPAAWEAQILAGNVVIIPMTRGTYDGGSPVYGPGYGSQAQRLTGTEYKINYFDPNWDDNETFYGTIQFSSNWSAGFVGKTKLRVFTEAATVFGKDPVEEGLTTEVVWNVDVTITQKTKPVLYDIPVGIFECFDITD